MVNKFEFFDEVGNLVDNEVGNGVGFGEDVEVEGDFVWKLYRLVLMWD